VTRLDERLRSRTAVLNGDTDRRDTAAASLRTFASTGLLKLAAPEINGTDANAWSTSRVVEVAFDLASRLNSVDAGDTAWEYHQRSLWLQLAKLIETLSDQGCESSAGFRDDLFVENAVFAGQQRTIPEMLEMLSDDVTTRQMLLDARSREILE